MNAPDEQPARPRILAPLFDTIPTEVKERAQLVVFRYDWDAGKRDWNKAPRTPQTGRLASSTAPSTWGTFDDARAAVERGNYDGIGYMFAVDDPYAGIDLDHCRNADTGELAAWAQAIVDAIPGYWEVSPRGEGIKAIVQATMRPNSRHKTPNVEMYDQGRYFTITGHLVPGTAGAIMECQDAFDALYRDTFPESDTRTAPHTRGGSGATSDDRAVIDTAHRASNGAKFARLWNGDTSEYGGDESAADLALCSLLAFYAGPAGAAQVDRLFRSSGLMRDKWDSGRPQGTYGSMTIHKAIAERVEFYASDYRSARASGLGLVAPQGAALPPDEDAPKIYRTDVGNAQRLVRAHGHNMRWCDPLRGWQVWDGARWAQDKMYAAMRYAKDTVRTMLREASDIADDGERKALAGHALKSENDARLNAMLAQARSEVGVAVLADAFDSNPWLFNVRNGTVDLHTGELRPHNRDDMVTKLAPVTHDATATCPTFLRFMSEIMGGRADLVTFMQRALGYTLAGDTSEHLLPIMYGSGSNGKSTLIELLLMLLGDYGHGIPSDALMVKKGDDGPKNEIAALRGVRLAAASESEEGRRFDEAFVKRLTGSDTMTVRFLYGEYFDMRPEFTVWLSTNHRPVIRNTDTGIWRRIRLIPFDVAFIDPPVNDDDREEGVPYKDKGLPDKLRAELPGILNWLIEGCLDWHRVGLPAPQAVRDATDIYRADMDKRGAFLAEACIEGPELRVPFGDLYAAYRAWCAVNNEHEDSARAFGQYLDERGFHLYRTPSARFRLGLAFRPAPQPDDPYFYDDVGSIDTCLHCGTPSPGGACCDACRERQARS